MSPTPELPSRAVETMAPEELDTLATTIAEHWVNALRTRISRSRRSSNRSDDEILELYLDMPITRTIVSTAASALFPGLRLQNPTDSESEDLHTVVADVVARLVDRMCALGINVHVPAPRVKESKRKVRLAERRRKGGRRRRMQVLETIEEEDEEEMGN